MLNTHRNENSIERVLMVLMLVSCACQLQWHHAINASDTASLNQYDKLRDKMAMHESCCLEDIISVCCLSISFSVAQAVAMGCLFHRPAEEHCRRYPLVSQRGVTVDRALLFTCGRSAPQLKDHGLTHICSPHALRNEELNGVLCRSLRPFASCCGASYGSRPPRFGSPPTACLTPSSPPEPATDGGGRNKSESSSDGVRSPTTVVVFNVTRYSYLT